MLNVSFWRKLWSLKLPGKILHFIWRVCRLCLPTAVDLRNRHVNVETMCSWCHNQEENGIHVLFDCVFARAVWEAVGLSDLIQFKPDENVFDVFLRIFTQCTRSQAVAMSLFCWQIWNRRNKWLWEHINISVYGTKATAIRMLEDWKSAQQEESTRRRGQNVGSKVWQKPIMGWVKINTDAAVIPGTHQIGTGAVIRDEDGRFLHARCMDIAGEWSVKEAEARSLRDAVGWTVAMGFIKCIFELDSKIVVDACNGGSGRSNFYAIIAECVEDFKHLDEVRVQFTFKSANVVAHTLARASISMSCFHEWQGNAPEFISDVLSFDLI
ncbi:hypothetical protein DCAR_0313527 [Daucus carota subsp. sativus]|uniref:Reverse transcriptase zinc-binding domain-containing protein n=1 Tax=Daucus carota subsp. sativus TaxID=79200 RepID=A0AAF0WR31_DAUCS|nr:hypothetical protein DCAR_0313527 [Daucus carota subsp. sativus]